MLKFSIMMGILPYTWISTKYIFINTEKKAMSLVSTSEIAFGHNNTSGIFLGVTSINNSNEVVSPYSNLDKFFSFLIMIIGFLSFIITIGGFLYAIASLFALSILEIITGFFITTTTFGLSILITVYSKNYFLNITTSKKGWKKLPYNEKTLAIFKDHKALLN